MVKADELIKQQKDREKIKYKTFSKIYESVEKKITLASASNYSYLWYEIPQFIIGYPLYSCPDCIACISKELTNNGFTVEKYEPNIILITWFNTKK